MDFRTLEAIDSLDKIKCTSCRNYLSYFPITASQNEILCGRCPIKDGFIRSVPYETLAQFLRFPCRYQPQGCNEESHPGEIPHHEENCEFRVFPCPMPEPVACEWEGPRVNLLRHCLNSHSDLVLQNGGKFELDLTRPCTFRNIVEHKNVLLFFERNYDPEDKMFKFALYRSQYDTETETFSYQLGIECEGLNLNIDLMTGHQLNYDLKVIGLDSLVKNATNKMALGYLVMGDICTEEAQVSEEMLSILKCSKCSEYAIPPIYHCSGKCNVVCSECRNSHQENCTSALAGNISVDKLAQFLNYPCKYKRNGCTFIAKFHKMIQHQIICEFSETCCPLGKTYLKCNWTGMRKVVMAHLQTNHLLHVSSNGMTCSKKIRSSGHYRTINFANRVFRLFYKKIKTSYFFAVETIDPSTDNFKFQIEILDPSESGMTLVSRKICANVNEICSFTDLKNYCTFTNITNFEKNGLLTFKVTILQ
ncbi:uncharacterized protein LOC123009534 [Tribolium madens]|uniref:uncharacterized protein LOC123009534 n=1 Tax=Tribolium madens TaxID=41895 RepID=UPI001CF72C91|nr:uncharacterized protein LOC123009534 [Tribolium madens]